MNALELVRTCSDGSAEMVSFDGSEDSEDVTYGLNYLGSGISRKVYALSDSYVVKVQYNHSHNIGIHARANRSECEMWEEIKDSDHARFFGAIVARADDYSWLIMERAEYIGDYGHDSSEWREAMRELRIGDLHDENYGTRHDGTTIVIDYGAAGNGNGMMDDSDCSCSDCIMCECGECECERCNPEGCQCASFEGCRWDSKECERCDNERDIVRAIVRGQDQRMADRNPEHGRNWLGRDGRFFGDVAEIPSHVLARLRRYVQRSNPRAGTYCSAMLSGPYVDDSRPMDHAMCSDCVREVQAAKMDKENAAEGFATNQLELPFSDRFQVGLTFVNMWHAGEGMRETPCYYVRDMFLAGNATRHNNARRWNACHGHEGYARIAAHVATLNDSSCVNDRHSFLAFGIMLPK